MVGRLVLVLVLAAALRAGLRRYAVDDRALRAKLVAGSRTLVTPRGEVEVAISGEGPAVLVSHGAAGGHDQGQALSRAIGGAFTFVTPSRAGYLRTPVEVAGTPREQAAAYVALLDALAIRRAAIVGVSAGGMSAVRFALDHPERCAALVLVSAVARRLAVPPRLGALSAVILRLDPLVWLLSRVPLPLALLLAGMPRSGRDRVAGDPEAEALLRGVMLPLPLPLRWPGMENDLRQSSALEATPLEDVAVPTLVVHGRADQIVPFGYGRELAERIPGAEFVPVEEGDHVCLITHRAELGPRIRAFLAEHLAA